ncbi:UPF0758 domain-containing protein [Mucilaginibacter sp. CAU 1740]|uniref:UPF0758 domain-containing protein n=1 Tax=Mucilaginibacter sp. CAU 1740 TaxID=3140365 RepID=UPI00325C2CE3
MKVVQDPVGVLALPEHDRPREKQHGLGAGKLSNTELPAILLSIGGARICRYSAVRKVMKFVRDDPERLLTRTVEDFCGFCGFNFCLRLSFAVIIPATSL